ncbi:hypothetical protein N7501_007981 [Penicillium viridicatum]|nr:hypothetical protein N7501_007981 [Penicillium viridicatum]
MLSQIFYADEHLEGVEDADNNSYLVHIIHILRENDRVGQLSADDGKQVSDLEARGLFLLRGKIAD